MSAPVHRRAASYQIQPNTTQLSTPSLNKHTSLPPKDIIANQPEQLIFPDDKQVPPEPRDCCEWYNVSAWLLPCQSSLVDCIEWTGDTLATIGVSISALSYSGAIPEDIITDNPIVKGIIITVCATELIGSIMYRFERASWCCGCKISAVLCHKRSNRKNPYEHIYQAEMPLKHDQKDSADYKALSINSNDDK